MSSIDINQFEFKQVSKKETLKSIIEALLFTAGEPLPARDIANIIECSLDECELLLKEMEKEFEDEVRGIKLISIQNAYQFVTKPQYSDYIQKLLKKNIRQSLSQASLESLAIIAYKQPITRIDIDDIRGVKSDSALQKLQERNLIKEVGRLDVPGRPILYGTTEEFLRAFGLQDLKEMPSIDLFVAADEEEEEIKEEFETME
ncbi:SMC-Scp complex subunit ScpB [Clostridium sp. YIM B02551]|uniref:SMC-Scp complex subunit ScpB n=1 Tax=Clostridium sp. YIM B02551 TaxID=2910679 RepID=UPI001EEC34B5|nr:SMC-Scp complex subunit ScpB [Clostridium sp. YIM B02551]